MGLIPASAFMLFKIVPDYFVQRAQLPACASLFSGTMKITFLMTLVSILLKRFIQGIGYIFH